ncbi:MAG: T9SS type A sorting domain-containing protein, partial [Chlamydiia bacterium]|nr:T9SS type A sorting domain-containing protein [Chlamydiia bacterium]
AGVTSTDIGVEESGTTQIGESLQLLGSGAVYSDFIWQDPAQETPGELNNGQTFGGTPEPTIIVVSPNGEEQWEQGSTHPITWTSINFTGNIKIELEMIYRDREVLVASTEDDGNWEWEIPEDLNISDYYVIIVSDADDGDPYDVSDNPFSIIEPIPVTPYTIYDIQYSTTGPSPHEGELVETSGVVTAKFESYFFIQDGVGAWNGIVIYPIQDVEVGDEITISGTVLEYNDKTEITDIISMTILGTTNLPGPVIISAAELSSTEDYESVLARIQNVTVTNEDLGYGNWEVEDQSGTCIIGGLGDYTYVPVLDDFIYSITGVVDYTYAAFKMEPRDDNDIDLIGVDVNDDLLTIKADILGNYPNPFNPSTTIYFEVNTENTENTELTIYNLKGQKIHQYSITNNQSSITWNGTDELGKPVTSGVYLYQLNTGDKTYTKKMLLLK